MMDQLFDYSIIYDRVWFDDFLTFMITCTLDFESGGSDTGIACVPFYL